jgi:SnoaL-like domain
MNEKIMDAEAARNFAESWHTNWCKVDIDAVVSHFAEDAEMRSPLAEKLTGSLVVKGSEEIRQYWKKAYGHVKSADLQLLSWSWDKPMRRLTVWWRLDKTRASEYMDFDLTGRVIRSEAFYGK